ncbi:MAG: UDP-N-acetylmuramoyl-L-alanyl-D-glutamate--2,6-diaminopimelate ligase [Lachnospiraceae bacterium]|nr:UDP-N-acetylmuramoyl-L-alanyl-D-glutamate--2,6-diaminopimelate ligase [Lachnospiraceae bacterium]
MKLSELLAQTDYTCLQGSMEKNIVDLVYDSRKAIPDTAFVCMVGAVSDGHSYIKNAVAGGCNTLIVEKNIEELDTETSGILRANGDITVIQTKDSRSTLSYMAQALYGYPAKKLTTIAITGTKGKTTTTFMIRTILEECGHKTGIIGTTGVYIEDRRIEIHNTTPESYDIQMYLAEMVKAGCDSCVMEVSSQALKMNRTAGIQFDYSIFTNLSPDHIGEGEHADYAEYVYCKSLLFLQSRHGIFNIDDKEAPVMMKAGTDMDIHTYGFRPEADLCAGDIDYIVRGSFIGIGFETTGIMSGRFEVSTPGRFSAYNAMAAILVTTLMGADYKYIRDALTHTFVRGRVESVKISDRFTLLIDYAHNAMSMESILTTMKEYRPNRIVSLFGCGGNRSKLRRYEMGEISGTYADLSIITADNSRFENVMDIIEDIKVGINKTAGSYVVIPDRKEAIKYSITHAEDGDIILLLGKGHEDYQEIEGIRHPFDERVIIADILKEIQWTE